METTQIKQRVTIELEGASNAFETDLTIETTTFDDGHEETKTVMSDLVVQGHC